MIMFAISLIQGIGCQMRLFSIIAQSNNPSCCEDIYKYKDDRLCCFQERWTCHPSLCEGATGNGDCGKYWHLPPEFPNQYGCVKLGANGQPEGRLGNSARITWQSS